jgi:hypothetical protein
MPICVPLPVVAGRPRDFVVTPALASWMAGKSLATFDPLPVHLEILSASRNQTFTCCHRLPAYLNSSSSGFSRPK